MLVKDIEKSTESNIFLLATIPIILISGVLMVFFILSFKWDEYSNNILNDRILDIIDPELKKHNYI